MMFKYSFVSYLFLITFLLNLSDLVGQPDPMNYSRVKILLEGKSLSEVGKLGIPIDHGQYKKNVFFIGDLSEREIKKLEDHDFHFEIIIPDVKEHYRKQNGQLENKKTYGKRSICNNKPAISFDQPVNFHVIDQALIVDQPDIFL